MGAKMLLVERDIIGGVVPLWDCVPSKAMIAIGGAASAQTPMIEGKLILPLAASFALDIGAIFILVFALYFPRHRRRDLVVAYLGVNMGVLAVARAFTSTEVTIGLGFGLFGVLSIIRLRSLELTQQEIAYYFVALALGVLGGVPISPSWLVPFLMAVLLLAIFVGDHPRLFNRYRVGRFRLDRAFTDEEELVSHIEEMLDAQIHQVNVRRVDFVNNTTALDIRYRLHKEAARPAPSWLLGRRSDAAVQ